MSDDGPSAADKLPSRPLSVAEGEALQAQETERSWVRPESVILLEDDQVVVALLAVNRFTGRSWLLGYSPDDKGWLVVDSWEYEQLEQDLFYERLQEWEAETFAGRPEWQLG